MSCYRKEKWTMGKGHHVEISEGLKESGKRTKKGIRILRKKYLVITWNFLEIKISLTYLLYLLFILSWTSWTLSWTSWTWMSSSWLIKRVIWLGLNADDVYNEFRFFLVYHQSSIDFDPVRDVLTVFDDIYEYPFGLSW